MHRSSAFSAVKLLRYCHFGVCVGVRDLWNFLDPRPLVLQNAETWDKGTVTIQMQTGLVVPFARQIVVFIQGLGLEVCLDLVIFHYYRIF